MNMYYINLLLLYLIEDGVKYIDLEKHPIYIHFINCETNNIPEFLARKKEVGIVLQRQFDSVKVDYRYFSVTLSIDNIKYRLNIDLSTIFAFDIVDLFKIEFESRLHPGYFKEILTSDADYMDEMLERIEGYQKFLREISVGLIPRPVNEKETQGQAKKISIDEVIKAKKV